MSFAGNHEELEKGKRWVEENIMGVAHDLSIDVSKFKWGIDWANKDADLDRLTLSFRIAGQRHLEKFSETDLKEVLIDKAVREGLAWRIKKLLESFPH